MNHWQSPPAFHRLARAGVTVVLLFAWGDLVLAQAPPPSVCVPLTRQAPKIDGVMSPSEWDLAVPVSHFVNVNNALLSRTRGSAWLMYDEQRVYVGFRLFGVDPSGLSVASRPRDGGAWMDEAVEVLLTPQTEPKGTTFQFIVNALDSIYDARNTDAKWNGEWEHAAGRTEDGWIAEVALPYSTLGVAGPKKGDAWRLQIGHDNMSQAVSEVSSWAFAHGSFDKPETWGRMTFAGAAVCAGVEASPILLGNAKVTGRAVNPGAEAAEISFTVTAEGETPVTRTVVCPPNDSAESMFILKSAETTRQAITIQATGAGGQVLYQSQFAARIEAPVRVTLEKHFASGQVIVRADMGSLDTRPKSAEAALFRGDKLLKSQAMSYQAGLFSTNLEVGGLLPGAYKVEVRTDTGGPDREAVASVPLDCPARPRWLHTDAGLPERVVPPFTPVRVKGKSLECWGRSYIFGDRSLPQQIMSQGQFLLTRPISLTTADGTDLLASPASLHSRGEVRATTTNRHRVPGCMVDIRSELEIDGFLWCQVSLTPEPGQSLKGLVLTVPLRRAVATLMHWHGFTESGPTGAVPADGIKSPFRPCLNTLNEEVGLTFLAESDQYWQPANREAAVELKSEGATSNLVLHLADSPAVIDGPRTFEFALQAIPVKPIPANWRERRLCHSAYYGMESTRASRGSQVSYPVADNIDLSQGTFEAWVRPDFDPDAKFTDYNTRGVLNRNLLRVDQGNGALHFYWDIDDRGMRVVLRDGSVYPIAFGANNHFKKGEWRHVAFTWGDAVRIYDDGKLLAQQPATGASIPQPDLKECKIVLGAAGGPCEFAVRSIRISRRALQPEEFMMDGKPRATGDTLLLDDFSKTETVRGHVASHPQVAARETAGQFDGDPVFKKEGSSCTVSFAFDPEHAKTVLDDLAEQGVKTLVYHDTWTEDFGLPRTSRQAEMQSLLKACHDRGMKLIVYFGYGLGDLAPETGDWLEDWKVIPINRWTPGDGSPHRAFYMACLHSLYGDFVVDGIRDLLDEFPLDGFYYDGTHQPWACMNPWHGDGYVDAEGNRHVTYPIRAVRDFCRRVYTMVKAKSPDAIVDAHTSARVCPALLAWTDQMWDGEQLDGRPRGYHVPLEEFRAEFMGAPYGIPAEFLVYEGRPFMPEEALSFTLLHDTRIRPYVSSRMVPMLSRIWEAQTKFGVDKAEWIPYWKLASRVKVEGGAGYVSLYLRKGAKPRALVVLSNLQNDPATLTVTFDTKALGLKTRLSFTDAEENEPLPGSGNQLTLSMGGWSYRLVRVE